MTGPDLAELLELPWRVWPPEERATRPADTYDVLVASGSEVRVNLTFAAASSIAAAVNALPALLDAAAERDAALALVDEHRCDAQAEASYGRVLRLRAERDALAAKVERVRALHRPDFSGDWCDCCWTGPDSHGNGNSPEWPCPTVRALDEEPQP